MMEHVDSSSQVIHPTLKTLEACLQHVAILCFQSGQALVRGAECLNPIQTFSARSVILIQNSYDSSTEKKLIDVEQRILYGLFYSQAAL